MTARILWPSRPAKDRAELSQVLDEHLSGGGAHPAHLSRHITEQEWAELGERGTAPIPNNRLLVFLGHILQECSPAERTLFLAHVPPARPRPVLVGWAAPVARGGARVARRDLAGGLNRAIASVVRRTVDR